LFKVAVAGRGGRRISRPAGRIALLGVKSTKTAGGQSVASRGYPYPLDTKPQSGFDTPGKRAKALARLGTRHKAGCL